MALSNPITDAFQGLASNTVGIGRGINPLSQPQITDILGFNIPGVPLISTRDYFLLQLQSWLTAIPLQTQWIAVIDSFPYCLRTEILQNMERSDGGKKSYDIDRAKAILTSYPFQKVIGCVFAQGAFVPGEQLTVSDTALDNNRGFIPGIVAEKRMGYSGSPLRLDFLETNTSIVDFIFRPWVMLASHYGLVARPNDMPGSKDFYNVKSNITLLCYTRSYQNVSQIPRKVFTFYNVVPTLINNFTLDYKEEPQQATAYSVNFTYTNYTIQNSMYFPIADIIKTVSNAANGSYSPVVSPLQNSSNSPVNVGGFF
jgi:hypothetical protein